LEQVALLHHTTGKNETSSAHCHFYAYKCKKNCSLYTS